jgi:hypothetical protein
MKASISGWHPVHCFSALLLFEPFAKLALQLEVERRRPKFVSGERFGATTAVRGAAASAAAV